jgi:hypothetical protein
MAAWYAGATKHNPQQQHPDQCSALRPYAELHTWHLVHACTHKHVIGIELDSGCCGYAQNANETLAPFPPGQS